ncbi:MAG: PIN domain-containing protein [Deltaproteobacteria bacterium]|nr:MAG: PIN domain-containing protein [Deltaproteobacteria bacterium]
MNGRYFLDTNVLVYANDRSSPKKQRVARLLIAHALTSGQGCLSTQILQEFFVVVTRKAGVNPSNARAQMLHLSRLHVVTIDTGLVLEAIDLHLIDRISFWDALVVKSARAAGCKVVFTEDLGHGRLHDGVRIQNPFKKLPDFVTGGK